MKAILQDIIAHTHSLGFIGLVKITGTDTATNINAMSEDRRVILIAATNEPVKEMVGTFGMPQLNKLKYHLDCPEYKEGGTITLTTEERNGEVLPTGLHFSNATGDFQNDYCFMNREVINDKLKTAKFNAPKWGIEVAPTTQAIQRFQFQAAANTEHTTFISRVVDGTLSFTFGDGASHRGEFVFASKDGAVLKRSMSWPVAPILSILKLATSNKTTLSIADDGVLMLTLDSGLVTYRYAIPAAAR